MLRAAGLLAHAHRKIDGLRGRQRCSPARRGSCCSSRGPRSTRPPSARPRRSPACPRRSPRWRRTRKTSILFTGHEHPRRLAQDRRLPGGARRGPHRLLDREQLPLLEERLVLRVHRQRVDRHRDRQPATRRCPRWRRSRSPACTSASARSPTPTTSGWVSGTSRTASGRPAIRSTATPSSRSRTRGRSTTC